MVKAIALFSGGLDSILAVKLVQKQLVEVTGLTFTSPFFNAAKANAAAAQIGLPLQIEDITAEYLEMLRSPRYGYGRNMNPCIDCHTLMLQTAGRKMEETGADFLMTGEVLGQRPMSQTKQSLYVVAKNSGYADHILRPLSAKLLDPIQAEREGKIDRMRLECISGRSRKDQMRLAESFGITQYPPPAGGCLLTDPMFARRLREMMEHGENRSRRDYDLLKYGRHFRSPDGAKIIVGRNAADNEALRQLTDLSDFVCNMSAYAGPYVLIPGGEESSHGLAAALCVRYSDAPDDMEADVVCSHKGRLTTIPSKPLPKKKCEEMII